MDSDKLIILKSNRKIKHVRVEKITHVICDSIEDIAEITSDGKRNHTATMNSKQTLHISQRKWKNLKESLKNSFALIGENNAVTAEKPSLIK